MVEINGDAGFFMPCLNYAWCNRIFPKVDIQFQSAGLITDSIQYHQRQKAFDHL
ncbi:Uncharacterised protein [Vibrio cholerae]|nr:Uncharacterised protein [Vibrio cholerae]